MQKLFFVALLAITAAATQAAPSTYIKCSVIMDIVNKRKLENSAILVAGDKIQAIGKDLEIPADATIIDLSASHCLPGLMDMHVHLFIKPGLAPLSDTLLKQSSAENALIGLKNAQTLLHAGFTTIRMVGDFDYGFASIALRDAIAQGLFQGPRMLVAPHALSPLGGHSDLNDIAADTPSPILGPVVAAGADAVRDAVRREIKYGADWIKVMGTGGVVSVGDNPEMQLFTDEEMHAFAHETHRHGKKLTAHIHGNSAAVTAANAGFDSIEHGTMLNDSGIRALKKNGTYLVPTLYVVNWVLENGEALGMPQESLDKARLVAKTHAEAVYKAYRAGVKIALGTDQIFPHNETAREFAAMANAGIAPWDVLAAATINAAALLGKEDELGTLSAGKLADIVAVPADPIEDIAIMEQVNFVMRGGRIIRDNASRLSH